MAFDPFKIDGPTCISFSGGRSSAYMLWRVIQANDGLPDGAMVIFANTGKEEEATLEFVRDCSEHWNIPITWVEFRDNEDKPFEVVSYETASRSGEPFEALIRKRRYLPNVVTRFCTVELKVRTMHRYLKFIGWTEWDSFLGIRADEPARVARITRNDYGPHETKCAPLAQVGTTKKDVGEFWKGQPFDLGLPNFNGVTMHGNCDLCFMKPASQVASLITEKPERAIWWARMEDMALSSKPSGARFSKDRPTYSQMLEFSKDQRDMFDPNEEAIACFCGD